MAAPTIGTNIEDAGESKYKSSNEEKADVPLAMPTRFETVELLRSLSAISPPLKPNNAPANARSVVDCIESNVLMPTIAPPIRATETMSTRSVLGLIGMSVIGLCV